MYCLSHSTFILDITDSLGTPAVDVVGRLRRSANMKAGATPCGPILRATPRKNSLPAGTLHPRTNQNASDDGKGKQGRIS